MFSLVFFIVDDLLILCLTSRLSSKSYSSSVLIDINSGIGILTSEFLLNFLSKVAYLEPLCPYIIKLSVIETILLSLSYVGFSSGMNMSD